MGVYIKGMEMPTNCGDCIFCTDGCVSTYCAATHEDYEDENFPCHSVPDWCPLVPVPPHGRLIDADAVLRRYDYELSRTYTDDFAKGFQLGVKAAVGNGNAVVIEAEEGE